LSYLASTLTPTYTTKLTTYAETGDTTDIKTTSTDAVTDAVTHGPDVTTIQTTTGIITTIITDGPTDGPTEASTDAQTDAQTAEAQTTDAQTTDAQTTDSQTNVSTDAPTTELTTEPDYPDNSTINSCWDWWASGLRDDGYYYIYPDNELRVLVYCDMEEGGWTIILNKFEADDSSVFYDRTYDEYVSGLGSPIKSNFWLGLRNIRNIIIRADTTEMRIEGSNDNPAESGFAIYDGFTIAQANLRYKITFGSKYVGNLPDVGEAHDENGFSAKDNDFTDGECPTKYGGGWWFK
jgi:hypothetical protein